MSTCCTADGVSHREEPKLSWLPGNGSGCSCRNQIPFERCMDSHVTLQSSGFQRGQCSAVPHGTILQNGRSRTSQAAGLCLFHTPVSMGSRFLFCKNLFPGRFYGYHTARNKPAGDWPKKDLLTRKQVVSRNWWSNLIQHVAETKLFLLLLIRPS